MEPTLLGLRDHAAAKRGSFETLAEQNAYY
jgi:hypothetical protein